MRGFCCFRYGPGLAAGLLLLSPATARAQSAGFAEDTEWRYFKGTGEASTPDVAAWRRPAFNDSAWLTGTAPFYYEDKAVGYTGNTRLGDMRGNYLTLFLRKKFELTNPDRVARLTLDLRVDDGCIVWLNGREIARVNMPAGEPTYQTAAVNADQNPNVFSTTFTPEPGLLLPGVNVLAVQAANVSLSGSSDFLFAAALTLEIEEREPQVEAVFPVPGTVVRALSSVEVVFNLPVQGVDAADLLVNGRPASGLEAHSPRDYTFTFPEPAPGPVQLTWAANHGITDTSPDALPFTGAGWSYTLDPTAPPAQVVLSEFLADNRSGLRDEDGARSDWIELRNLADEPVSLEGWFLTDNAAAPTQWRLPAVTLAPRGYLLVWASGKDRRDPARELHTNFKLSNEGEYLALVDPQTNVVDAFTPAYPPQQPDVSYGRDLLEPARTGYFATPTPGQPNATRGPGFAPEPVFSLPAGLYATNRLVVSLSAPSGTIYYTTNGRPPTPEAGAAVYTGPLTLNNGTVLRARTYQDGLLPSPPVAAGYVLVSPGLTNFTSNLPLLVIQPVQTIPQDQRVVVHVTALEPFRGRAALLGAPAHLGLGTMEIRGQSSVGFPKKQYNLELTDAAGLDQEVPLLGLPAESDWVLNGPYSDKSLLNNFLAFELHEQMGHYAVRRRFVEVFIDETRGQLTHPTDYRGIYVLLEKIKIDGNRVAVARMGPNVTREPEVSGGYIFKKDKDSPGDLNFSTRGGAGFSAQNLKYHDPKPREINAAQRAWLRNYLLAFEEALYAANWLTRTGAQHYSAFIDTASFVDNHWIVEFTKQIDGYRLSNFFHKDRGGKVKMDPIWDWNLSLGNADYLEGWNPAGWYWTLIGENDHIWLRRLITGTPSPTTRSGDPDFNQALIDRWSELRETVFNPTNVLARIDEIAAYLEEAKDREFARWPRLDSYVWPNPAIYIQPTYARIIANKKQWVRDRFNWIDAQFPRRPLPDRPAGFVRPGTLITLSASPGTIYYTLDGSDPRLPGGGISPRATPYLGPVRVDRNVRLVARLRVSTTWSGPTRATYLTAVPPLRVSEILFHPAPTPGAAAGAEDPNDYEFIELVNTGATPLDLAGFRFTRGIQFDFATGTVQTLAPGARVVVAANRAAFERRYGPLPALTGEYTGRLDNSGETLQLVGPREELVQEFRYDGAWYAATRGVGFALVPADLAAPPATWSRPAGWRVGSVRGGTPGAPEPPAPAFPAVVVNEVLANPGPGQRDAIELFNPGPAPAEIGGWYLSDDRDTPKYRLPPGTVVPAGGFWVVDADQFNPPGGGAGTFGLSAGGEEVWLFSANAAGELTGYVHGFAFGAAPPGMTWGRQLTGAGEEQFVLQAAASLGAPNVGPAVGPVVFSEIMYHPPDVWANGAYWDAPEDEYLELLNLTAAPVPLFDPDQPTNTWRLAGGVRFRFPAGFTLAAGERLLLVGFDPQTNAAQLAVFRARYAVPSDTRVLGPWSGKLDNGGETLRLLRPIRLGVAPDAATAELEVDRVEYTDHAPWPAGADGFGYALQRAPEGAFGNDPARWFAAAPTPGRPPGAGALPAVAAGPTGLATLAGRDVTLQVLAEGPGPLRYQWRHNGRALPGATNASLTLPAVSLEQAGDYDVLVFNAAGAVAAPLATVRVAPPGADTDADGLDDLYELTHGLDPAWPDDPEADPDGDGLTTGQEYLAGTNPLDPASRLGFDAASLAAGGVTLHFQAAANRAYVIEYRDRLEPGEGWRPLVTVPVRDDGRAALREEAVTDTTRPAPVARFYRIRAGGP